MENQEQSPKKEVKRNAEGKILLSHSEPEKTTKAHVGLKMFGKPGSKSGKASDKIPTAQLWSKTSNGTITFEQKDVIDYLSSKGFGKYYLDKKEYVIVKKEAHILKEVSIISVKEALIQDLNDLNEEEVLKAFYEEAESLVNKVKLELLPNLKSDTFRDNKEESYFTFENAVVKITKDKIVQMAYTELPSECTFYESQIIKNKIELTSQKSVFETFIYNVSNKEDKRFNSLKSAIGYLLHRCHNSTETRAIIFTDEQKSYDGDANGGTGKSIVARALNYLRNVAHEDGKGFKPNKNFAFQSVNYDTDIICFNDANKDFDLENFYAILTDGLTVEKKYKDSFRIPPELTPKMLITSNYIIRGRTGFTDERRRFEIEFSPYYGKHLTPADEFGHQLFNDWDNEEWNRFYNFMASCVQLYLTNGLIPYEHVNMKEKHMVAAESFP